MDPESSVMKVADSTIPSANTDSTDRRSTANITRAYSFGSLTSYSCKDRFLIRAADLAFFLAIKLIGKTLKFEVDGQENWEAALRDNSPPIYTFWHNRI